MNSKRVVGLLVVCLSMLGLQVAISEVQAASGTIAGTVYNDKNSNGANDGTDAGVSGVVVSAYDSSGTQVGTTTTSGNGTYSLNVSSAATNNVRIEFTTPNGYQPSFQGAANATSIQFVSIPATNVNYAIIVPGDFCQNNVGTAIAAICMRPGTTSFSPSKDLSTITSTSWKGTGPTLLTKNADTGSLWGMAFDAQRQVIFGSAVLRRHAGLGPKGIAGIYATSRTTGGVVASWDLSQSPFNLTFSANNSGFSDANRGLSNSSVLSADPIGYSNVGKVGIGDIDMSSDGQWLFVSNLYEKKIHRIAVADANSDGIPELGSVTSYTIPANTCSSTTSRPWGLNYNSQNDELLVGVVCSNELQTPSLDSGAGTTSLPDPGVILKLVISSSTFTTVSSVDFDYVRGVEFRQSDTPGQTCKTNDPSVSTPTGIACLRGRWHSWTDDFAAISALPGSTWDVYSTGSNLSQNMWWAQPIISDIEVLPSGEIVLGVMDRFGMQMGTENERPNLDPQNPPFIRLATGYIAGDTLLLCPNGGSYIQNNADGCTPATSDDSYLLNRAGLGARQAYHEVFDDNTPNGDHLEMTIGGLAYNRSTKELAISMMDPSNVSFTNGIRYLNSDVSSSTFGQYLTGAIFTGQDVNGVPEGDTSFRKSTSMGDLELICDNAPVQIGNRVWIDTNQNGIQDPGESPVAGVYVMLYDATGPTGYTNQVGTAITNANGEYFFSSNNTEGWWEGTDHLGGGLIVGRSYRIRMDWPSTYTGNSPLAGHVLTQANATSTATALDTSVDNNATYVSSFPEITVPTVTSGMNNHTYDFGFIRPKVSVGNFVWIDSDADGIQDQGEPGLAGAVLTLRDMSNNSVTNVLGQVVGSQTTASNGAYLFENLPPGQYKVNITYPAGYQATTASAGSDRAVDSSTDTATSVNLPNNGDADVTLDFGVVVTPAPAPAPAPELIVEAKPSQSKKAVAAPKKAAPAPAPEPAPAPAAPTTGAITLNQLREEYTLKNMEVRTAKNLTQKQKDAKVAELQAEYKEKKKAMASPKFRTNEPINSTEDVLTGYVGNDLPKVFQLISRIQQAFPNVVVSVDAETFNNVMNSEGVRPFVSDGVVIYGVTVNGNIYINPEVHNSNSDLFNTSIHEFGHVWQDFLSTTEEGMALLNRGYELIKEAIGVDSYITSLYNSQLEKFNGDERKALNEVTSILIGNKGAEVVNRSISSKIKDWLSDVWNYISSAFKVSDELTDQDIQDMTLEEFIGTALADMLSGKQIKMSDSQLKTLKDSDAAFSTSQNIFDIVSVGRQNGFSDASIKQLLLKRGFKSSDIDAVMQVNLNLFDKLPPAFANVDGGVKVGLDLYNQVLNKLIEFQKAYGYKSMADIRQKGIELLQSNPIFQSQTEQVQKELIVGFDKNLNTKANKSVSALIAGIKNDLKQRVIGSKNLRDAQIAMRTFIRNALPKSKDYSQAQINKLTKIITDTTVDSFMAQSERVIEIVEKQIEKMRDNTLREILSLVTKKAQPAKTTTGKRRSKGLDAQGQSFFEAARDIIKAAILNDTVKMMELAQEIADTDAIDEIIAKDLNGETLTTLEQKLLDKAIAFDTFSDLMSMDLDQLTDVLASLKDERRNSIARLKQTREARALRYNQIRAEADAAVQESFPILFTEDVDADGNTITRVKDKNDFDADKNAIWDSFNKLKIWDGIKKFSERWSLDSLSKIFGFFRNNIANIEFFTNLYDIKGKFFTSKIYDKLNVMYDSYLGGFYKEQDNLDVLANSIDGITKGYKQIRKMLEIGVHEFTLNGKQRLLSGDQMLRLYALSKNSVQRQKLRNMGFTDADMQRIESLLPEQTIEFADKLVNYFSNQYYESVNSVYSSLNDVNLQYVPNYFPTITVATSVDGQVLLDGNFNGIFNAETAPALRERSDTSGDIDLAPDFTSVVESHFQNMEKYKAFAAGVKEMNALFQSKGFNALMEQTSTKQLFKNLVNYTINPNAGPKVPATILDKLYNKYTGFALAFKPIQLPKQLTAFIFAYDNYQFLKDRKVPGLDTIMFMVDNAKVIATLPAQFRKAKEISPTFRDRVAKGIEGDVFGLEAGSQTFKSAEKRNTLWGRFLRGFKTVGAAPTIAGDLLSVMSYMAVYNRNIANGMNPEEALLQFNNYNATLQTRRGTEKSTLQTSQHAAVRAFTMFGSTAFLQMNGAAISMQNIMRSIKNKQAPSQTDIRRFVISFGLANFLFTFVANFPKFMSGDDEDREKAKRAMYDALIGLNLIYQIPLIGSGIEIAVNKARGERMPVEGTVNPITSVYRKIDKGYKETGEWTSAIKPAIELGIGAQLDPLIGVYSGAVDGFDENTVYDIMGISQSYRPSGDTKKEAEQKDKSSQAVSDISQFGMTRDELKKSNPGMYKVYFPVEAAEDEEKKQEKKRMQPQSGYVYPGASEKKKSSKESSGGGYVYPK